MRARPCLSPYCLLRLERWLLLGKAIAGKVESFARTVESSSRAAKSVHRTAESSARAAKFLHRTGESSDRAVGPFHRTVEPLDRAVRLSNRTATPQVSAMQTDNTVFAFLCSRQETLSQAGQGGTTEARSA